MGVKIQSFGDKLAIFEIKLAVGATLKWLIPSLDKTQIVMKNLKLKIVLLLLVALIGACNDNNECLCPDDIIGNWEVKEFMSVESVLYAKDNNYNPSIEFLGDGTTNIKLDINACFGSYETGGNSSIVISNSGCTEACCDSDFSLKFMEMLPQVSTYELENDTLKLHVSSWGWIELQIVSE